MTKEPVQYDPNTLADALDALTVATEQMLEAWKVFEALSNKGPSGPRGAATSLDTVLCALEEMREQVKRRFGRALAEMHDVQGLSWRRIGELLDMDGSHAWRLGAAYSSQSSRPPDGSSHPYRRSDLAGEDNGIRRRRRVPVTPGERQNPSITPQGG